MQTCQVKADGKKIFFSPTLLQKKLELRLGRYLTQKKSKEVELCVSIDYFDEASVVAFVTRAFRVSAVLDNIALAVWLDNFWSASRWLAY